MGATLTAFILLLLRKALYGFKIRASVYYIPMSIYAGFVILSTILAEHKGVALGGFVDRHEGMYALLAYVIAMFITINLAHNERNLKYITGAAVFSALIIGVMGTLQYMGYDFFLTDFGKKLILPEKYHCAADSLTLTLGKNWTYATFYNPNYVGSYTAILLPVLLGLLIYFKKIRMKLLAAFVLLLIFLTLVGSTSRSGMAGSVFAAIMLIVMFRKPLIKKIKIVALVCLSFIILLVLFNSLSGGLAINKLKSYMRFSGEIEIIKGGTGWCLKDIKIKDNKLTIETLAESATLILNGDQIRFVDGNNRPLAVKKENNTVTFKDEKYSKYILTVPEDKKGYILINIGGIQFDIYIIDGKFLISGMKGKPSVIEHPEKWGFKDREGLISARAYIWSVTLPMLKNTLLIGHGPDTYAIYFPQNDCVGKLRAFGSTNIIIAKPHNMYLQIGVNTGVISLAAIIALFLIYFISSVKLYIKRDLKTFSEIMGVSILAAIAAYCVAGLFNDSIVSVASIFWILLGTGVGCNYIVVQNDEIAKSDSAMAG